MEVPYPVDTIAPSLPSSVHPSLPVLPLGVGDGASKFAVTGKYKHYSNDYLPHLVQTSSATSCHDWDYELTSAASATHSTTTFGTDFVFERLLPSSQHAIVLESSSTSRDNHPGRNRLGIGNAPDHFDSVVRFAASVFSRPDPDVEAGDGVFRALHTGEYPHSECPSPRTDLPVFSNDALNFANPEHPTIRTNSSLPSVTTAAIDDQGFLRIYYQNVRGLKTKIDDFFLAVTEAEYDVIVLTETWLDDSVYSSQLFGDSYTVFRTDRNSLNSRKSRSNCCICITELLH